MASKQTYFLNRAGDVLVVVSLVLVAYVGAGVALAMLGVFPEAISASGTPGGPLHWHYAGPPLVPGVLLACIVFPAVAAYRPSSRAVVGVSCLIALVAVTAEHWALFFDPVFRRLVLGEQWHHPYLDYEIRSVQRELTYGLICSLVAGVSAVCMGYPQATSRDDQPAG